MRFARPELLWLLLLAPLLAAVLAWLWHRRMRAMEAWSDRALWPRLAIADLSRRAVLASIVLTLTAAALIAALARPRWGLHEEAVERRGVDLVLAVDTSLSMAAEDVRPNRLWLARQIARELLGELAGGRVGLLEFEGLAEVRSPLTLDLEMVEVLLASLQPATLPQPGTALATALATADQLFPADRDTHRAIVLLSDGEDHAGELERTADRLREHGIVVHAVGVGTRSGGPLPLPGRPSREYKQHPNGEVVVSRLEEGTLRKLAELTGGRHVTASGPRFDLTPIVDAIREAATGGIEEGTLLTQPERFQLPLGLGALALVLYLAAPGPRRGSR